MVSGVLKSSVFCSPLFILYISEMSDPLENGMLPYMPMILPFYQLLESLLSNMLSNMDLFRLGYNDIEQTIVHVTER